MPKLVVGAFDASEILITVDTDLPEDCAPLKRKAHPYRGELSIEVMESNTNGEFVFGNANIRPGLKYMPRYEPAWWGHSHNVKNWFIDNSEVEIVVPPGTDIVCRNSGEVGIIGDGAIGNLELNRVNSISIAAPFSSYSKVTAETVNYLANNTANGLDETATPITASFKNVDVLDWRHVARSLSRQRLQVKVCGTRKLNLELEDADVVIDAALEVARVNAWSNCSVLLLGSNTLSVSGEGIQLAPGSRHGLVFTNGKILIGGKAKIERLIECVVDSEEVVIGAVETTAGTSAGHDEVTASAMQRSLDRIIFEWLQSPDAPKPPSARDFGAGL